jgi:hypothetical protein
LNPKENIAIPSPYSALKSGLFSLLLADKLVLESESLRAFQVQKFAWKSKSMIMMINLDAIPTCSDPRQVDHTIFGISILQVSVLSELSEDPSAEA